MRRAVLFLGCLFVVAMSICHVQPVVQAQATTYYVDASCATPGDGTTSTCDGDSDDAWDDLSDITGLSAGDSVLLKRGEVWREQLTWPTAGTSGNPITLGAYGTGEAPVITGADVMTGFSAPTSGPMVDDFEGGDIWDAHNGTHPTIDATSKYEGSNGLHVNVTGNTFSLVNETTDTNPSEYYIEFRFNAHDLQDDGSDESYIMRHSASGSNQDVKIESIAGTVKVWASWDNGPGFTNGDKTTISEDTWYKISLAYKSGSGDGYFYFWIDDELISSDTSLSNSGMTLDTLYLGNGPNSANWTKMECYFDDFWSGERQRWSYAKSSVTTEPNVVAEDLTELTNASGYMYPGQGEWYWDSNNLYVRSSDDTDPDTHSIEAAQRDYCFYSDEKDYGTLTGVTFRHSNLASRGNITLSRQSEATLAGWTIEDCDSYEAAGSGIFFYAGIGNIEDLTIQNCDLHDNGVSGIRAEWVSGASGHENLISSNRIYNNPNLGVQAIANYWIIEHNEVYGNGANSGGGIGIANFDQAGGYGEYCIVRYNHVYDNNGAGNDGSGIYLDYLSDNSEAYYNIVHGNWGPGIDVYSASNATVYNNTVYGNATGSPTGQKAEIRVIEDGTNECLNVLVKNNIGYSTESGAFAVYVDNLAADSVGLDIDTNLWYRTSGDWFCYGGSGLTCTGGETGTDVANWNDNTGVGTDLNSDPILSDPSATDFRLGSASPARDAGTDVSLTSDYWGNPVPFGSAPDIGAHEFIPATRRRDFDLTRTSSKSFSLTRTTTATFSLERTSLVTFSLSLQGDDDDEEILDSQLVFCSLAGGDNPCPRTIEYCLAR